LAFQQSIRCEKVKRVLLGVTVLRVELEQTEKTVVMVLADVQDLKAIKVVRGQ
jgi:hypothetical protein